MSRTKKCSARERQTVVMRYRAWLRNAPKRICAEHGISRSTLTTYVREFAQ